MSRHAVLLVVFAAFASVAQAQMRAQFEQAFATQQQHLVTDTTTLATSVWNLVCDGCAYTTPAQNHSQTPDQHIFFSPQFTDPSPYLGLIEGLGVVARYNFVAQINDDISNDDLFTNDMFATLMSNNFKELQTAYENFYQGLTASWQSEPYMTNASLAGGAGLGFGVQVSCGSQTVLSIGGGCGSGFSGTANNMTAGGGGGAGIQAFGTLGSEMFNSGGGGGGGLQMLGPTIVIPNWGTATDNGQIIDRQVWTQLAQDMATCYKNGNLLLRAAGGGGGGLWAGSQQASPTDDDLNDDPTPVEAMAYGGGWGFSFTFASPTGSGTGPGPVVGSELGHVATNCHSQCAFQTSTGQFYTCFCPCLKQGFTKLQMPWASHIQCYGVNE